MSTSIDLIQSKPSFGTVRFSYRCLILLGAIGAECVGKAQPHTPCRCKDGQGTCWAQLMPVGDTGRGPGQGAQHQIAKHAFSGAIFVLGMPFLRAFYTVYDVEAKAVCLVAECRSELDKAKRMGIARAKHKSKQALLHVVSCRCSTRLRRTQNAQVIADAGAQVKLVSLRPAGTDLRGKAWTQSKI